MTTKQAIKYLLDLGDTGLWTSYGVAGYGDYRFFSKKDRIPSNYSYKEAEYTGFGGVLLIYGVNGPLAYDRACPNEAKQDVVLNIDKEKSTRKTSRPYVLSAARASMCARPTVRHCQDLPWKTNTACAASV